MERKIGEIFECNGEWYQCVECDSCDKCSLRTTECGSGTKSDLADEVFGECSKIRRLDSKHAIFKKLEKIGKPYDFQKRTFQTYKLHTIPFLSEDVELVVIPSKDNNTIEIEIKQNKKEDMEIDKVVMNINDRDYLLDRLEAILHDAHCQYKNEICEVFSKYIVTETASGLKPFDLNAAKLGKPVCTRDGRKARIICFDLKNGEYPIVAAIENDSSETLLNYTINGEIVKGNYKSEHDLMMLPEKKEGWINVYNLDNIYSTGRVYFSKEEAEKRKDTNCVATIKIEWEE